MPNGTHVRRAVSSSQACDDRVALRMTRVCVREYQNRPNSCTHARVTRSGLQSRPPSHALRDRREWREAPIVVLPSFVSFV